MAANDGTIASRLQLDGEKEYKQALNDAYRSLRVLRSELKAETAELGRNASEQDKARTKIASLQKQIAEQQKVVKTLEKALADSKREYADNQEVQDKCTGRAGGNGKRHGRRGGQPAAVRRRHEGRRQFQRRGHADGGVLQ